MLKHVGVPCSGSVSHEQGFARANQGSNRRRKDTKTKHGTQKEQLKKHKERLHTYIGIKAIATNCQGLMLKIGLANVS